MGKRGCPKCGRTIDVKDSVCQQCGATVSALPPARLPLTPLNVVLLILATVAAAFLAAYIFGNVIGCC